MKTQKAPLSQMGRKVLYATGMLVLLFGFVAATEHLPHSSRAPVILMVGQLCVCAAAGAATGETRIKQEDQ
jgi:hypothetical protein